MSTVDPRTHGVGTGDVDDVAVRGRVSTVTGASLRLEVETDPRLSPIDVTSIIVALPAECIVTARLVDRGGSSKRADLVRAGADRLEAGSSTSAAAVPMPLSLLLAALLRDYASDLCEEPECLACARFEAVACVVPEPT